MSKKTLAKKKVPLSDKHFRALFSEESTYVHCVLPLLSALNWQGGERDLLESAPYLASYLDLAGFINVMMQLGYEVKRNSTTLRALDARLLPSLFVTKDEKVYVLLKEENNEILAFDAQTNQQCHLQKDALAGTIFLFSESEQKTISGKSKTWLGDLIDHYRGLLVQVLLLTLAQSFLYLSVPIFVMNVYDKVITSGSYSMLYGFTIGILLSLGLLGILQQVRYHVLAYVGAQLDQRIGNTIIEKLLALPLGYTENSAVSTQIAQVKNFDTVREFFSGQPILSLIDTPFLLVFVAALGIIGHWLVLVPILMFLLLLGITWFLKQFIFYRIERAANESSGLQKFVIEMLTYLRVIRLHDGGAIWLERYTALSASKGFANYQSTLTYQVINSVAEAIMILSGLAILGFGALSVLNGMISVGALLASMILTWRILGPLKALLLILIQTDQIKLSIKQINNLMQLEDEYTHNTLSHDPLEIKGDITFSNTTLRFPPKQNQALSNVSLHIPAGTIVGVTGRSGAGKSSFLKSLLNIHPLSSGDVYIDDHNILQYPPRHLRQAIAYVPQENQFFYGSLKQNLLLRNPTASDEQLQMVLEQVGIWNFIQGLSSGLQTQIRDHQAHFPRSFLQRLNIARALLGDAKILLLDEATDNIDQQGDNDFQQLLKQLRGKVTVLMVTQRPSHLRLADQVIVFQKGQILAKGEPEDVVDKLLVAYENGKI